MKLLFTRHILQLPHQTVAFTLFWLLFLFTANTLQAQGVKENWTDTDNYDVSWYGDGSAGNFEIQTPKELAGLAVLVNGMHGHTAATFAGKTIQLVSNIDLSDKLWTPIGNYTNSFGGTFDGNRDTIKGMVVNIQSSSGSVYAGLFGITPSSSASKLENLHVQGEVSVSSLSVGQASIYVGGLIGRDGSLCMVQNCSFDGDLTASSVTAADYSNIYLGGLVGQHYGVIHGSRHSGSLIASSASTAIVYCGGLAGSNISGATIQNSGHTGNLISSSSSDVYCGGVAGQNMHAKLYNNYSRGSLEITAGISQRIGGVTGCHEGGGNNDHIQNNYFEGTLSVGSGDNKGAIVGENKTASAVIQNNYWKTPDILETIGGSDNKQDESSSRKNNQPFTGINPGIIESVIILGQRYSNIPLIDALHKGRYGGLAINNPFFWQDSSSENDGYPVPYGKAYWIDEADTAWYSSNKDATAYTISTAKQLAGLAVIVNGLQGNTAFKFTGKTITLANNIDLSGKLWTPIGASQSICFQGTFSGHMDTIKGMEVDVVYASASVYAGLFACVDSGAIVENLHVHGSIASSSVSFNIYTGGIIARNAGTIQNCSYCGELQAFSASTTVYCGGIVGYHTVNGKSAAIIQNSHYNGDLLVLSSASATINCGAIAGYNSRGKIFNNYGRGNLTTISNNMQKIGGIVGCHSGISSYPIQNNYFEGCLSPTSSTYKGGILGENATPTAKIQNNYWKDANSTAAAIGGSTNTSGTNIANNSSFTNKDNLSKAVFLGTASSGMAYNSLLKVLNAWVATQTAKSNYKSWYSVPITNEGYPLYNTAFGDIIYVKADATGNGSSWNDAMGDLSDALLVAHFNSGLIKEIYVSEGTYAPKYNPEEFGLKVSYSEGGALPGDKTFLLPPNVKIYGGFKTDGSEATPDKRAWVAPYQAKLATFDTGETVGSATILNGAVGSGVNDTAFHVVMLVDSNQTIKNTYHLDGFRIINGRSKASRHLTINNTDHYTFYGAGLYSYSSDSVRLNLLNNRLSTNNTDIGGGMYISNGNHDITHNLLDGNTAGHSGGGMYISNGNHNIANNLLSGNTAYIAGGGIYVSGEKNILVQNSLCGNKVLNSVDHARGGGIYTLGAILINNTLYNNSARGKDQVNTLGQEVYCTDHSKIYNNIIYNTSRDTALWVETNTAFIQNNLISDSVVFGHMNTEYVANNLFAQNPFFADAGKGLLQLSEQSPAINVGSKTLFRQTLGIEAENANDAADSARLRGSQLDIGAFEYQGIVTDSIRFVGDTITLRVGDTINLQTVRYPNLVDNPILNWQSLDTDIATVNNHGTVKALKKGFTQIVVTSSNMKTDTCYVVVERQLYTDTTLLNLSVDHGTLTPIFDPMIKEYNVVLCSDVKTITIAGTTNQTEASVSGNVTSYPLPETDTTFVITVTAENTAYTGQYKVNIIQIDCSTEVANVTVSHAEYAPDLDRYVMDCGENSTTITITPESPNSKVIYNGIEGNSFSIDVSRPDIYVITYTICSQDYSRTQDYTLEIEKRFEFNDIVVQKWDNVLMINNNPANNRGYRFTAFAWYRNGSLIGTGSYHSAGSNNTDLLDENALYYAVLTTEEGKTLRTCEASPVMSKAMVMVYPNPVERDQFIKVSTQLSEKELKNAQLEIFNSNGMRVHKQTLSDPYTEVQMPFVPGIYFIRIQTADNEKTMKVLVR